MSLIDRALQLLGKQRPVDAGVLADRARQQDLHGQGLQQSADDAQRTRLTMEAELDRQRRERSSPSAG